MPEHFLRLRRADRLEALTFAAEQVGRPVHILEKDVWVVWTLSALFASPVASGLTFKGGTSLSKVYGVIERFSEDIDLTYDIRRIAPEVLDVGDSGIPPNRSQAGKWSKVIRTRLPEWIAAYIIPLLREALEKDGITDVTVAAQNQDQVLLQYGAIGAGTGYVSPQVLLEFGARSTGEPHEERPVVCYMEGTIPALRFPRARVTVMKIGRTFWEKATAVHVYCVQERLRAERYARHWHDLVAIMDSSYFDEAVSNGSIAADVARHKSAFFVEKDGRGNVIDYHQVVGGGLHLVPRGQGLERLRRDYARMVEDGILLRDPLSFDALMERCREMEKRVNAAVSERGLRERADGRG